MDHRIERAVPNQADLKHYDNRSPTQESLQQEQAEAAARKVSCEFQYAKLAHAAEMVLRCFWFLHQSTMSLLAFSNHCSLSRPPLKGTARSSQDKK